MMEKERKSKGKLTMGWKGDTEKRLVILLSSEQHV